MSHITEPHKLEILYLIGKYCTYISKHIWLSKAQKQPCKDSRSCDINCGGYTGIHVSHMLRSQPLKLCTKLMTSDIYYFLLCFYPVFKFLFTPKI